MPQSGRRPQHQNRKSSERANVFRFSARSGPREAHAVTTDDWPVMRKLRDAGKLAYADDEVREGMDEIARRGLDR